MTEDDSCLDDLSKLIEEVLGPDWTHEDDVDQLIELVRRYDDPRAFRKELAERIARAEDEFTPD